ncbi:hypothetical protein HYH02_000875 [Chlamydomonas schloesseri]|uniref:Uncharacterized protein n=1 Tax=Chlamydomonas schloesseri TaxID=2026947 RepID=A0A835WWH1_9CHLO|nr:hypothetical protein HYH02_000875 [Chlamydomonas schloesseri]|eukprot:KAG2455050.1 hypothetical protein HYH02_000875 [Chlamydomonas schloesseri]
MMTSSLARILPGLTRTGLGALAGAAAVRGQAGETLTAFGAFAATGHGAAVPSAAGAWFSSLPHPQQQQQPQPEQEGKLQQPADAAVGDAAASAADASGGEPAPARPAGPASRRDKAAAADTVYPSSKDDNMGVQRNWFNALFSQLNVVHRTGMVPHMKGRQQEVFVAVEREFEVLWEKYIKDKNLQGTAHRGMLLCCLAIATHKVLRYESGDDELVKEVVKTNLGGVAVSIMTRLHNARLWLLLKLLAEDPYKQAVRFLPTLQGDLGALVVSEVSIGEQESTWTTRSCSFHDVLAAEGATELLPEFCCQYSMQWLEAFSQYGVRVGLEQSLGFGDECCQVRISRPWTPHEASKPPPPPASEQQQQQQQPK